MYYTNYFEGINIDNVISELDATIISLNAALNNDSLSSLSTSNWESDSKPVLVNSLKTNNEQISVLIEKINSFKNVLLKAKEIQQIQESMKSIADYAALASSAELIDSKLRELDSLMTTL